MTVISSIHQPRYSIYKLFDTLMLLSDGESVFHGPASEALNFFASASLLLLSHIEFSEALFRMILASVQFVRNCFCLYSVVMSRW